MTDAPENDDLKVENAMLRGSLWLATRALKNYHDAPHTKADHPELRQLKVPASYREKATDAITRAQSLLVDRGRGR